MAPGKFPFRGLAVKQTAITLLVALMVGLSIGAVEIVSEWYELRREALRVVGQDIELVRASASEAAYQLNPGQAGNVVEGLLRLDYISRAELRDNFGNLLAQQQRPVVEDGNFWLGSRLLAGHEKGVMRLDRLSGAELTMVGHLEVGLDARSVGGRFIGVVISKVLIRVLWAILLSLLLAGVYYWLLTRPMLDLVRAIANVDPSDPARNLLRLPARHEADELGQLAQSLNALLVAFERGLAQRDSAKEALGTLNRELEARIHERTRALENTMTELEAKRLDAEQASQAKSQFLATMSHEIRTPLNGILGMAQLLMMPGLSPQEQQDYARTILNSGRTLLSLLNDILDLSKVEAGKLELQLTPFDCGRLLDEVATLFAEPARVKGLTLETRCSGAAAGRFRGDAVRLRQMLSNLVSNAIKFSDQGTILIEAGAEPPNGAHADLVFSVTDRGIGIAPEDQLRLFQAFSQVDGSNTRRYGGTGLGLSIVQRLARLMHGEVGVDSVLGRGARFWFRAQVEPIAVGDDSRQAERLVGQPEPILLPSGAAPRVLVVEDDATNQRLIQAMLEKLGVLPVIVADGRAAVDTLGGGFLPDLVLMDCQMPVMDGYEATRLWRQQEPASGQRLPIIALTANVFEENRLRCRAAGMDDFLAKPIHLQALAGMLNKWLRGADGSGWAAGYPATGGEAVLFDGADFAERFGGDRELMACVIDIYLAEWPQSLSELEAALDAGDLAAAHRLAHALKGACGNVSGLALAALAARVESAAAAGDMTAARAAFGESAVAAQSLDQSLRTLRAEWQVAAT